MQVFLKLSFLFILFVLPSCRATKLETKPADFTSTVSTASNPAAMKVLIGFVHMVNREGNFVLIKSRKAQAVEPGASITSLDPSGQTASRLRISDARKGAFLTADILEGNPQVGEQVLMAYSLERTPAPGMTGTREDIQVLE